MNTFRPIRIRSQRRFAPSIHQHDVQHEINLFPEQLIQRSAANASWWLTRMLLQSRELDGLISDLRHQRRSLTKNGARRRWRAPSWLEASLPSRLMSAEYDALILALSARRADLGRTYLPLMTALVKGGPVPVAVTSIIVA